MKLSMKAFDLELRHEFTISRGSENTVSTWVVELERAGIVVYGEVAPYGFYGQTMETVREDLEGVRDWLAEQDPLRYRLVLEEADERLAHNPQALCAIDLALHDWIGKKYDLPVYRLLGLDWAGVPATTYTIGIASNRVSRRASSNPSPM